MDQRSCHKKEPNSHMTHSPEPCRVNYEGMNKIRMKATESYQSRISVTAQMDYCPRIYQPGRVSIVCLEIIGSTVCPKDTFTWKFKRKREFSRFLPKTFRFRLIFFSSKSKFFTKPQHDVLTPQQVIGH